MTDAEKIYDFCDEMWERQIIPQLTEYIKIPAKSPAFDVDEECLKTGVAGMAGVICDFLDRLAK